MINLMPNEYKQTLRYARRNAVLLHWFGGVMVILVLAVSTIFVGRGYLQAESKNYAAANTKTQATLKEKDLEGTLNKVEGISTNLKLIIQVLSRQILFSKLLQQIGAVMPPGTILYNLDITQVEGGLDITADAVDQTAATQVQVNLSSAENKLFDKVDIVSVQCDAASRPTYPCRIVLRALFLDDNPFSFVNQSKGTAP